MFKSRIFSLFLVLSISFIFDSSLFASTQILPSMPNNYVVDIANIVDNNLEKRLNAYLFELEKKTSVQMIILTIESLDGDDIERFSIDTAQRWRLGQKGKDNGILLVIAVKDRKYRIEVGYGLESILPDSLVGSIGRQYLVPYFKKGDFGVGIFNTTVILINKIANSYGININELPTVRNPKHLKVGIIDGIILLIIFGGLAVIFIKNPKLFLLLLLVSPRGTSHWGGGGGGFGGGGSSGNW